MAAVFHLADVFQKIIHRLYHRTFAQQYLVPHIHQLILHIFPQSRDQLNALFIQTFKQILGDVTAIPEEFPLQFTAQNVDDINVPVIYIAWRKAKGAYFPAVVDNQV